jgi:hypothetical protein
MKQVAIALLAGLAANLGGCSKCGRWFWEQPQPESCGRS